MPTPACSKSSGNSLAIFSPSFSSFFVVSNALRLKLHKPAMEHTNETTETSHTFETKETNEMTKTIHIEGMMCPRCVAHVKKALDGIGVEAEVILEKNCAIVDAAADMDAVKAAITEAGYDVVGIE